MAQHGSKQRPGFGMNSRLALGTAQFGIPYGIGSRASQVSAEEAARILSYAKAMGLDTVDTAIAYGESEERLGSIGIESWQVISKLPPFSESCPDVDEYVCHSVAGSLQRLKLPRLRGLLLHRSHQLLGDHGDALYRALVALKDQGMVEKIGVSIYGPDELDALWPRFRFDLIQAPFSVFDRRLATTGWLSRLRQAGVEIHIRSVFLQGLLLRPAGSLPAMFGRWQQLWDRWHGWLAEQRLTPLQACLGFAKSQPEFDRIIVGVKSLKQLQDILASFEISVVQTPDTLSSNDLNLISPSRWGSL